VTGGESRPALALVLAVLVALATACALVAPPLSKLPDGSYRVACKEALSSCLKPFETVCGWHGYDVISASEDRRRGDLRDVPELTIASEAQVRCKEGKALFGGEPAAPVRPATPAPPLVAPAVAPAAPELPSGPTVELLPTGASPPSCLVPPPDGGAAACGAPSSGTPGAAAPK